MRPAHHTTRRGSIGMAMVIVLVILQLLIVGVVISGARDQNLAVQRLDSLRAGYAAESGVNMAVREMMRGVDEDGDGTIGTISDDGNAANDPALGTARFTVRKSVAGDQATLTARGRAAVARRQVTTIAQLTGGGLCAFGRAGSTQPRYSTGDGITWGSSSPISDIGAEASVAVLRLRPSSATSTEHLLVTQDSDSDINVVIYDGNSWGSAAQVCSNTGGTQYRPFDAVYEQTSGHALIVYWKASTNQIGYRTWNGVTVSGESILSLSGATDSNYLALYARPGSDQIILLAQNNNGSNRLSAAVWSGSSWGSWTHLHTDLESDTNECFCLAFESLSRDGLVVYVESNDNSPRYRTWNGSSWSSESSMPSIGADGQWLRLASDPNSNTILFGSLDSASDVNTNTWDGSSWGSNMELDKKTESTNRRQVDLAFEKGTSRAVIVYSENSKKKPRYRVWNGSWSAESIGPDMTAVNDVVTVVTGAALGQVLIGVSDQDGGLHLMAWDGTTMSVDSMVESALGGPGGTDCFAIASDPATPPKVVSWTPVAPD